jgi:methyl-accepting chemotaxis protein
MTVTARCILAFAALDALFNPLVTAAYIQLIGFPSMGAPFAIFAALWALKIAACAWFFAVALQPHERLMSTVAKVHSEERLREADRCLQHAPRRFGIFYAFTWSGTYVLGFIAARFLLPELEVSSRATHAVSLVAVAVWLGGFAFAFPIMSILTSSAAGHWSIRARAQGVSLERAKASLQTRIGTIALALGLGPTLWMMALGYMKQVDAQEIQHRLLAESAALTLASDAKGARLAVGGFGGGTLHREVVDIGSLAEAGPAWLTPSARSWLQESFDRGSGALAMPEHGRMLAFRAIDERRVAIAAVDASSDAPMGFILSAGLFALVVGLWAPLCALVLGRSVSAPLERLTASAREIVEEGKQSKMGALPVPRNDEVGVLSERFNDLIEMMRDLSQAAGAIANGDLRVNIDLPGELPDAFRRMVESLRAMVSEIRVTSVNLASAATEIFAASQEQEAAATSQSSAMEEISRTMDSLSESAAHVSNAVQGVLDNAERTLDNTDGMVKRIAQLSQHAGRIAEILEVIREIADRSDLLALNGSLEATRAGEGGQGFGLVAAEMRRLAERVTASVHDIKKLVIDITDSGATTVMATEESKRLAEGTTEAARQITFVSQQQRSGTEQVSQSVKNIAEVVTQAVSATTQTRTSAELLKRQADGLSELVRRFEVASAEAE